LMDTINETKQAQNRPEADTAEQDGTRKAFFVTLRGLTGEGSGLTTGSVEAMKRLKSCGYLCIVIYDPAEAAKAERIRGEVGDYIAGLCTAPQNAVGEFIIGLSKSWMVCLGEDDVRTGTDAGCGTIWIGYDPADGHKLEVFPTTYAYDFLSAVKLIELTERLDQENMDPQARYVLFHKTVGQPLWLFEPGSDGGGGQNDRMFIGSLTDAVYLLIRQDDFDNFALITLDRYLEIREVQMRLYSSEEEIMKNAVEVPVDQIEFHDFLFIDIMPGITTRIVRFTTYLEWLMRDNFKALEDRLKEGLKFKSAPNRGSEEIIEGMIAVSEKEFAKKAENDNYYACSFAAIMFTVRYIFTDQLLEVLKAADQNEQTRFLVRNYFDILHELLLGVEDLCALHKTAEKRRAVPKETGCQMPALYSACRSKFIHTMMLHQVLRQELYGKTSLHAFSDRETSASIGTIRLLIELRLRRSFGVLAFLDADGQLVPLDMSLLFKEIRNHRNEIDLPVKLENIERLYRWANGFIHSGRGDYPWIPFFVERMLVDFSFGKEKKDGSWNVNNGIRTSQKTIDDMHRELLEQKNPEMDENGIRVVRYRLCECAPECDVTQ